MFRTSNPALQENVFQDASTYGIGREMTIQGTVNKAMGMLVLLVMAAAWIWSKAFVETPVLGEYYAEEAAQVPGIVNTAMMGGLLGGFVFAMITIFKKTWAPVTAPIYAVLEGLFLGAISAMFEMSYPGIVLQAVGLTFGTMFALLMAYKSGLIKVTSKFAKGVVAATGGIALLYFASIIMGFFGVSIPVIHSASPLGIGFSLFVCVIAALNLVLDFDFIERGSQRGLPKYMEWYGAFGLMVTLIWLYLEILRLLAKMNSRR